MATAVLWALTIIGGFVVALVLVGAGVVLWGIWQARGDIQSTRRWHEIGSAYMRQRLLNDAWWFSEDEPTMNLLRRLGEGDSVDHAREDWRRERTAQLVSGEKP